MKLHLDKRFALADEQLAVVVTDVMPGAEVSVSASLIDLNGIEWRAEGRYHSNSQGIVDLARCASIEGTYVGVDGDGLIWSMRAQGMDRPDQSPPYPTFGEGAGHEVTFSASSAGSHAVAASAIRSWNGPGVVRYSVNDGGLVGVFHEPPAERRRNLGALVMTGSDGAINEHLAPLLAAHGYPTLAIAYFGYPGLPRALAEIPLEYFAEASRWLRARCEKLCVFAISRGTEAAAISAATFESFADGLILFAPSHIVETGIDPTRADSFGGWTLGGKTVPFASHSDEMLKLLSLPSEDNVLTLTPVYLNKWLTPGTAQRFGIQVENISVPVLLFSGANDQVWPAAFAAERIVARLRAAHPAARVEHIDYQGCGHAIVRPGVVASQSAMTYHPHGAIYLNLGGLPSRNAWASRDAFHRSLNFLATL